MTDLSTLLAPASASAAAPASASAAAPASASAATKVACPFTGSCHFPRLADPTASDRVLQAVYCAAEWSQCSVFGLLMHGHEVSPCLWPDGEVKIPGEEAVGTPAAGGQLVSGGG
jgi:hypothetical protein